MIKAVIFDLDGTLLYTIEDIGNACNAALKALGLPEHTYKEYEMMVGNGREKLIERMLPEEHMDLKWECMRIYDDYYLNHLMDVTVPYKGIPELVKALKDKNCKLAVMTNKEDSLAKEMIEKYFPAQFDIVMGRRDGVKTKPDPEGVNILLKRLNINKEDVVYIGDSDVDVMTGKNAGLKTVSVSWGYRTKESLLEKGPDYLCDTVEELGGILCAE